MRRINLSVGLLNTKYKKRAIAIAIVCSFLLVLPSCIPHLRNPQPGPALPASFNLHQADSGPYLPEAFDEATSSENSSQVRIEEFFDDPILTSLIHEALAGNQELRVLNENIQVASNEALLGHIAFLRGDFRLALAHYLKGVKVLPDDPALRGLVIDAYYRSHR